MPRRHEQGRGASRERLNRRYGDGDLRIAVKTIILMFAFMALPSVARAGRAPGQTPNYADIRSVTVHRFTLVGRSWPRFDATFQLNQSLKGSNVVFAQLNARQNTPLRGEFRENDPNTFRALQAVLSRDRFYDARLTPQRPSYLDGPEDSLTVVRCSVATTIGMVVGGEIDQDNGQVAALLKILDDLQATVFALPWKVAPTPSPSP